MTKLKESPKMLSTENIMLENFINGFREGGFHKGMKSMMYLRSSLDEDGFTFKDFTGDFNKLLKHFDAYWKVIDSSMDIGELESTRREFCVYMEALLSERFDMDLDDKVYWSIHDYTL